MTKLDETYIFKSVLQCDSFDVTSGVKIPFFRVSVTIEPGRSLLQFVFTNCWIVRKRKEREREREKRRGGGGRKRETNLSK